MATVFAAGFVIEQDNHRSDPWSIVVSRSTAGEFHARSVPVEPTPQIWMHAVTSPALVLGSTQRDDVVDREACERAGVEVVRRRSGGGAVWLAPDEVVWIDVIVPCGAPGWSEDIHRPMVWLGRHLAAAFRSCGLDDVVVHDGAMITTAHSKLVCFDGLGPGELTFGPAKLVGISQRRTREAARLQCCWYSAYRPHRLVELLSVAVEPDALRQVAVVDPAIGAAVPAALLRSLNY